MAVYEGETLQIYEFDHDDCHLHRHQQCPSFDQNSAKLSFLHVYNLQDTDEIRSHLLIGVSAKSISTWYLEQDTTSHTLDIQFRGTVEMEWAQPPSLVVSSSQWATNTSSKLFHRLASKDQNVLVAVLGSVIYFYGFEGSEKIEWKCLFSVETELENISQVRCTPGTIAIVSGQEKPCQLSIWMEMRPGFPPTMVKSFSFK